MGRSIKTVRNLSSLEKMSTSSFASSPVLDPVPSVRPGPGGAPVGRGADSARRGAFAGRDLDL